MSNPKRQHFIPQSYLKNFAEDVGGKFFVEGKLRDEAKPKDKLLSIKDICVDKNLYTIPNSSEADKYKLEKYYAEKIDSVYPEIYKLLIDPSIIRITSKQRVEIILTTMSLFFRTPKFLNINERRLNLILDHALNNHCDSGGNVKFKFGDYNLDFHVSQVEEARAELKIKNKLKFLQQHLKTWHDFAIFKVKAGFAVFHVSDDFELITSDNPVIMHSVEGNPFNVFDPTNIISVPLDNKHFLIIYPNTEVSLPDRIFRGERDKWFVLTSNLQVDDNSEEWILGKPKSVTAHLGDQEKYGEHTHENIESVEEMIQRAKGLMELSQIAEQTGFVSQKVADKVKELRKKDAHKDDPDLQKIILELDKNGFSTA